MIDGKLDGTEGIIGAAIEVHRELGPGLLESIYQRAMIHELTLRNIPFRPKKPVPVKYKGVELGSDLQLDIVAYERIILELKPVDRLGPIHDAQLITYLKLTGLKLGLLMNFNFRLMKEGIKRIVH